MRIVKLNKRESTGSISEEGVAITPFALGLGLHDGRRMWIKEFLRIKR